MLGDVNISAILDSFSVSYDKRVRPNYGGKIIAFHWRHTIYLFFFTKYYPNIAHEKYNNLKDPLILRNKWTQNIRIAFNFIEFCISIAFPFQNDVSDLSGYVLFFFSFEFLRFQNQNWSTPYQ